MGMYPNRSMRYLKQNKTKQSTRATRKGFIIPKKEIQEDISIYDTWTYRNHFSITNMKVTLKRQKGEVKEPRV